MGNHERIRRMCIDGMLIAVFVVLGKFTLKAGPIHLAFSGIAILFATGYFGLGDGLVVALLGEAIIQLTSSYGISLTTPLWILPPAFRALGLGVFVEVYRHKGEFIEDHVLFYALGCAIGALLVTFANAGVELLDAKIIGYSSTLTWAILGMRVLSGLASAAITAAVGFPTLKAVRRSHRISATKKDEPSD